MEISGKIEELMRQRGLSRYKLAKLTNVPYTTLIKILDGTTKNPQIETLSAIADYLGVSVDYLSGQSAGAIIELELRMAGMSIEELAARAQVRKDLIVNIDKRIPDSSDYEAVEKIAKVLNVKPSTLRAALARQEPPAYEGPTMSVEEAFAGVEFDEPETLAAHRDSDSEDWTEEELETIEKFKQFVRSQRKQQE